ncbi:MAG: PhoD-like phosphatase N-terminal domain-containing protein, partial [Alcanivoracaceae bacterium]|nr:PhoD-like phosphatase N-terminal domain-containing protein [Alcanivoracaceae bacterium]
MTKKFIRRQVLKLVLTVMLFPIACSRLPNTQEKESAPLINEYFVHGIASGDPDQTSVVIWTRVSHVEGNVDVQWQLATDASFKGIVK